MFADLDQTEAMLSVRDELSDLLGDTAEANTGATGNPSIPICDEAELAALLAETVGGDCWQKLARVEVDPESRQRLAEHALTLYRDTEQWVANVDSWEEPPAQAAFALRRIADGYALLSRWWSDTVLTNLDIPTRERTEDSLSRSVVAEWAAALGHPLQFGPDAEPVANKPEPGCEKMPVDYEPRSPSFESLFAAAVNLADLLDSLSRSERGRAAIHNPRVQAFAAWLISDAHAWERQVPEEDAFLTPIMAMTVFAAQALFIQAHGRTNPGVRPFPSKALLRDVLSHTDAYRWVIGSTAELPGWLTENEA